MSSSSSSSRRSAKEYALWISPFGFGIFPLALARMAMIGWEDRICLGAAASEVAGSL